MLFCDWACLMMRTFILEQTDPLASHCYKIVENLVRYYHSVRSLAAMSISWKVPL